MAIKIPNITMYEPERAFLGFDIEDIPLKNKTIPIKIRIVAATITLTRKVIPFA